MFKQDIHTNKHSTDEIYENKSTCQRWLVDVTKNRTTHLHQTCHSGGVTFRVRSTRRPLPRSFRCYQYPFFYAASALRAHSPRPHRPRFQR
jgi:hypothetical protein